MIQLISGIDTLIDDNTIHLKYKHWDDVVEILQILAHGTKVVWLCKRVEHPQYNVVELSLPTLNIRLGWLEIYGVLDKAIDEVNQVVNSSYSNFCRNNSQDMDES